MKQFATIFLTFLICSSCNNNDQQHVDKPLPGIDSTATVLKAMISRYPDSLLLRENLIQYYRDNGTYDSSIAAANAALKKDSSQSRLWVIKGTLEFEDGEDTVSAIKDFEKAISISPDPEYIVSLGNLYAQTRDPRALTLADLLLKDSRKKSDKDALYIKGLFYNFSGNQQMAIPFFDQCLAIDYTFMFAYREKGIALYDMGKYNDALTVLNKAVTLQNNFDEGYYWMGRCLEKLHRNSEAMNEYRTALMYDPDYIEAKEALEKLGGK